MLKIQRANRLAFLSGTSATLAFACSLFGAASIARADDIKALGNIGDANKSVGVITHYDIHAETKSLDLVAAAPPNAGLSPKVERELAVELVHQICAEGAVSGRWSARMFLPGESSPVATCRFGERRSARPAQ